MNEARHFKMIEPKKINARNIEVRGPNSRRSHLRPFQDSLRNGHHPDCSFRQAT
jgi:hypothetical protein